MLRPSHRITDGAGPLGTRIIGESLGYFQKQLGRYSTDPLHCVGRVTLEVAFEKLKDASRMLEGHVPLGVPAVTALVGPNGCVVFTLVVGPAGKVPVQVLRPPITLLDDHRGIGEMRHVLSKIAFLIHQPIDDAAEEHDVRSGP